MEKCCCGRIDFLDKENDEFVHNDIVHQIAGPIGNYCGTKQEHLIDRLADQLDAEQQKVKELSVNSQELADEIMKLKMLITRMRGQWYDTIHKDACLRAIAPLEVKKCQRE